MSDRRNKIMQQLIDFAYEKMEQNNAYPFCAFIVKDDVVLSKGYNSKVNDYGDKTYHGEMEAMSKAAKLLNLDKLVIFDEGYELYTTCEPCLACFDTALWAGIRSITCCVDHNDFPDYFHEHNYNIDNYLSDNPEELEFQKGILREQGLNLFRKAKEKYGW